MNEQPTRTFVLLKPDAIERGLVGEILKRFERKGFKIVKAEMRWADEDLAKKHYAEHQHNTGHYSKMVEAITRGPVMAIILEGVQAVAASRQLIGCSSPIHDSAIGTIRADLALQEPYNLVHGSDSNQAATREITLWFSKEDAKVNPISLKAPVSTKQKIAHAVEEMIAPPKKKPKKGFNELVGADAPPKPTPEEINEAKEELLKIVTAWWPKNENDALVGAANG